MHINFARLQEWLQNRNVAARITGTPAAISGKMPLSFRGIESNGVIQSAFEVALIGIYQNRRSRDFPGAITVKRDSNGNSEGIPKIFIMIFALCPRV
jgi:hypothetical protein